MLDEFSLITDNKINYHFEYPGEDLPDSLRYQLIDSLRQLGVNATNAKARTKEGEEQQLVYPGALVEYKGRVLGIDFLQGQNMSGGLETLHKAETLLEYKLASSIRKIIQEKIPRVGYLAGNGEPLDNSIYDLMQQTLKPNYPVNILPLDQFPIIPEEFSVLIIVKPTIRFTDQQKLKLDQFVMRGGKLIWALDNLYASIDSLQRSEGSFIAFDMGLNLEDQLFRYGVRINQDLVQDVQCDKIPSVIGTMGGKPQIQLLPWPYFPLLTSPSAHPISDNLDYIVAQFPQSIDTVQAPGIRKTVLLATSLTSRVLSTPAKVEWQSVRNEDDLALFNRTSIPIAILLEGKFKSLFANRITSSQADTLRLSGQSFIAENSSENKMVVISDGDLFLNGGTQADGPLPMGMNVFSKMQYANRDFLLNTLEYMLDPSGIMETRSKDFKLRLLDPAAVEKNKTLWQILAFVIPISIIASLGVVFQLMRKRMYAHRNSLKG
jgi:gliding-associated putative ABC transporter substrate-binding component GldG